VRRCRAWIGAILLIVILLAAAAPTASAATPTAELRAKLRSSRAALRAKRARLWEARAQLAAARQLVLLFADTAVADDAGEPDVGDLALVELVPDPTDAADATADPAIADATADPATADVPVDLADVLDAGTVTGDDAQPEVVVPTAEDIGRLERRVARLRASTRDWRKRVEDLARRVRRRERIAAWNRRGEWRPLVELAARRYGVNAAALYRLMMYESGGRRTAGTTYKGLFQYHPGTWKASWNPWRGASIYNGWAQIRATAYAIKRGYGPHMWPSTYPRAF